MTECRPTHDAEDKFLATSAWINNPNIDATIAAGKADAAATVCDICGGRHAPERCTVCMLPAAPL